MNAKKKNEETIFKAAIKLDSPAKRSAYLKAVCGDDADLLARMESLLAAHDEVDNFLESPILGSDITLEDTPDLEVPGAIIDRYKLLEKIGEGGMATVYMAQQEQPIRRKVALKIIKAGMDSKQVIARFEAERQALAMMDHPNIAKVLDAGTTETGRPYFVMELVKGVSVTDYCDQNNLTTKERLDLFIQVCNAVQHAHQKGIIHRDIKPTNVMVTLHDGLPVPKVIDFGIAKATSQRLTEKTLFTRYAQMIGTPEYMSPEQAEMSGLDVDTRTDIYSLGVLLYELLTGVPPFEASYLHDKGYAEIQRIIREEEPIKPSTKLSTLGEGLSDIAKHRHTEPQLLQKLIQGDLDWIVMKMLEKDRARRYDTATELAADIKRHLRDEPVIAGPPSAVYKFHKYFKRNAMLVTSVAAVSVILILASIVSIWQMVRANQAADRLEIEKDHAFKSENQARSAEQTAKRQRNRAEAQERIACQRAYAAEMNIAFQAWEQNSLDRARELLELQRPAPGQEDLRGFEWRYLWRQSRSDEIASLEEGERYSVAFSRNGRYLALGSGTVVVRDLASGIKVVELPVMSHCVVFSPRDNYLITAAWKNLTVWDTNTWRPVITSPKLRFPVAFSPDGQWVVASTPGGYVTLDTTNWKQVASCSFSQKTDTLSGFLGAAGDRAGEVFWWWRHALAFSPDSRLVVTPGSADSSGLYELQIRRATSLELLNPLGKTVKYEKAAAFSHDGKRLLAGEGGGNVAVWDIQEGKITKRLRGHKSEVVSILMSPDGKTCFTASLDSAIIKWDATAWEPVKRLRGHLNQILALAMSPNGKLLASAAGGPPCIKIWNTSIHPEIKEIKGTHCVLGFTGDSHSLIAANQQGIVLWDIATGKMTEHTLSGIRAINFTQCWPAVHGAKKILAMGLPEDDPEALGLWDITTGDRIATWPEFGGGPVTTTAVSKDGRLVAAGTQNGGFAVFDLATKRKISSIEKIGTDSPPTLKYLTFSPDGRYLAMSVRPGFRFWIWDTKEQRFIHKIRRKNYTNFMEFSPDGQLLAEVESTKVTIWEIPSGKQLAELSGHPAFVTQVAFTPDNKSLAVGLWNGMVKLRIRSASWQEVELFQVDGNLNTMAFSPDGRYLAIGYKDLEAQRIQVLEAPSFEETDASQQADDVSTDAETLNATDSLPYLIPSYFLTGARQFEFSGDELQEMFEVGKNKVFLNRLCREELESAKKDRRVELIWKDIESDRYDEALQRIIDLRSMAVYRDDRFSACITRASKTLAGIYLKRAADARCGDHEYGEVIRLYEGALLADPNYVNALRSLAWLLAACPRADLRDNTKAVDIATRACEAAGWKDHRNIAALAAVYAAKGDYEQASRWQKKAIDLLTGEEHRDWQAIHEFRQRLYESGIPFRGAKPWNAALGGMVACWNFEHSDDKVVKDSSGNGIDGRLIGDAKIVDDQERGGKVLFLDGDMDWVNCGNDARFDITSEITLACWIKVNRFDKRHQTVISKGDSTWRLARDNYKDGLGFSCSGISVPGNKWGAIYGKRNVNDGKWHHVAGVFDGSRMRLYLDGELDVVRAIKTSGEIAANSWNVLIGANEEITARRWRPDRSFDGLIDDMRIYDIALSKAEIKVLYENTKSGSTKSGSTKAAG